MKENPLSTISFFLFIFALLISSVLPWALGAGTLLDKRAIWRTCLIAGGSMFLLSLLIWLTLR